MKNNSPLENYLESIITYNENLSNFERDINTQEKYSYDITNDYASNTLGINRKDYENMKILEGEILLRLQTGVENQLNPNALEGIDIGKKHREWLTYINSDYSFDLHLKLCNAYLTNDKIKNYYDYKTEGCLNFLEKCISAYVAHERENNKTWKLPKEN